MPPVPLSGGGISVTFKGDSLGQRDSSEQITMAWDKVRVEVSRTTGGNKDNMCVAP